MKLSKGNKKMTRGFLIWNIDEIASCPGSTPLCRQFCYAKKASTQYPDVLPSRILNRDTFDRDEMVKLIAKTIKGYKAFKGFFRIHEAGDFYSQEYFDAWKYICGQFPDVKFLAFTKSFHLSFKNIPANMQLVASIMPDTLAQAPKGIKRAFAGKCDSMPKKTLNCPGSCDSCGMCWELNKIGFDVHFDMH